MQKATTSSPADSTKIQTENDGEVILLDNDSDDDKDMKVTDNENTSCDKENVSR